MDQMPSGAVRDIMSPDPARVAADTPVQDAAALMARHNIGAVLVCQHEKLVGILTERDLLRAMAGSRSLDQATAADLMTPAPVTVPPSDSWLTAVELMRRHRVRHLPVVVQHQPVGMISMRDLLEERGNHLERLVQERTRELAAQHAVLQERERLMQLHLNIAARLQRQLLPVHPPELPALSLSLAYHPLDQVSGDYYDFAALPSGHLGILLADATGHGVSAAFVSVMAKTAFHAYAQGIESPAAVLQMMNQRLADLMGEDHFLTMFYGVVERTSLRLTYALAGHPRPLLYVAATRRVERLEAEGPVIGLLPNVQFEERSVQLAPGDVILIYTDGVTECRNPDQDAYGPDRLAAFLATSAAAPDPVMALDKELALFRGTEPFHDDVTCIGLSVQG